jgi:integrase
MVTTNYARRVIVACSFVGLEDLDTVPVQRYLARLSREGKSVRTRNAALQAVKQFARWLVVNRRMASSPLAHLRRGNEKLDPRRPRRELTVDETARLIAAAEAGRTVRGVSGPDRAVLYAVALSTGLRASELASLTPESFAGDSVTVEAKHAKNRKSATLPLPSGVLPRLRQFLRGKPARKPLWGGNWARRGDAMIFVREDLEKAGVPFETEDGRADLHALRHTYISRLIRSGASPKTVQTLARHHSASLTLDRYTHVGLHDLAGAVDALPELGRPAATGAIGDVPWKPTAT